MKYYAIIEGKQSGPFELGQLPDVGIRPSTYVWCQGMKDWEKAEDVAEVCRLYRNRIYDLMHPPVAVEVIPNAVSSKEEPYADRFSAVTKGEVQLPSLEEMENRENASPIPKLPLFPAALSVLAFPPMGIFALVLTIRVRRMFKISDSLSKDEFIAVHEFARRARMLTLMSFFLGLLFYSIIFH